MDTILGGISEFGVLPVIQVPNPEDAEPLAQALSDGGLPLIEITFRNGSAEKSVALIRKAFPDMIIGAGTILDAATADLAVKAGADFLVSPCFNPRVAEFCKAQSVPYIPGCVTPGELERGIEAGLNIFKFFPAEPNGGLEAVKLLAGPYGGTGFLPTGGISFDNLPDYLSFNCIAACGGSFMATASQIAAHDWNSIRESCKRAVDISLGFELAHVGINCTSSDSAVSGASDIAKIFLLDVIEGKSSVFADRAVELMKAPYYGSRGHIGFSTRSATRALAWFRRNRIPVREESIRYYDNGHVKSAYLTMEIEGHAFHIVQQTI